MDDPAPIRAVDLRPLERALGVVPLKVSTRTRWSKAALEDPPTLLEDHCQCELKAAQNALALIGRNGAREVLVERLQRLAREELRHYRLLRGVLKGRGIAPRPPRRSPYLAGLLAANRGGAAALLDALVVSAVVEARSCERFLTLAQAFVPRAEFAELGELYGDLARSESGHASVFVETAKLYFPAAAVEAELDRRLELEARILEEIPVTARMHGGHGA